MRHYIGIIHKDPGSDFGISFPDFPGCISAGSTLDEARSLGEEALAFHVRGMVEDGDSIPEPSSLEAVMSDRDFRDGVAVLVPLQEPARIVRINVTMPEETLRDIDRFAEARGLTRSGFLQVAAKKAMSDEAA
jgi:predicted RNase H-like HicB family nuclease